ncbi:hypothetical protein ACFPT7_04320 [Acidicapsa dinghuensis]|uniref:Glycosyltransferase RgtA/B/C/D-like domain-containing protein n=1 Tax=Acidicapsa dinghuensis TaxID=2218256 RepID=A0ABW1EAZ5_9BACT|nr:hypothetical protein [Acidicapsa dinghuensis]
MFSIYTWLRNPIALLAIAAGLIAFAVQSGEPGSADTTHRLQSTHALWTSEPPVFPYEYPEFGVHGRNGSLQSWYGIGQSLLMLPADIIATGIEKLPIFADYNGNDPSVRSIVVSFLTSMLVNVLTALVCFRFLSQLRFPLVHSIVGTLALLLLTTHLHYTQNMMENNYICLLTLIGFSRQYEWLQNGSRKALFWGSAALGLNLLTRLTTGMDLICVGIFILLVLLLDGTRGIDIWKRCRSYIAVALPVYLFFGFLDRHYQFYRFGSFFNTYVSLVAKEARERDPSLPLNYPFTTPLHTGLLGALFAPEKSIFLFDPLLILTLILAATLWKRFTPVVKAYLISTAIMLVMYLCFYGRYFAWAGDFAWGDRYVSTTVEFAALLAVPLLLRHRHQLAPTVWATGIVLIAASAIIQIASLAFWLPLEIYQEETLGHPTFVILLRLKNIAAFAFGKMSAWGLDTEAMHQDPWDYTHLTAWNFLPFQLMHAGQAPKWAVDIAFAVWGASIAALGWILARLRSVLKTLALYGDNHASLRAPLR